MALWLMLLESKPPKMIGYYTEKHPRFGIGKYL